MLVDRRNNIVRLLEWNFAPIRGVAAGASMLFCRSSLGSPLKYLFISGCLILIGFSSALFSQSKEKGLAMNGSYKTESNRISEQHKYAYIDKTGRIVLEVPAYDSVGSFSEGIAPVWIRNRGWGFIGKTGDLKVEPQFQEVLGFSDGLAGVKVDGKWGFIDKSGSIVIKPQFDTINPFSEGFAVVVREASAPRSASSPGGQAPVLRTEVRTFSLSGTSKKAGILNASRSSEKVVFVIDTGGQPILSRSLNDAVQIKYDEDARFSQGVIEAFDRETELYGFVDKTGSFVIPPKYGRVSRFSEGLARVSVDQDGEEKIGFIDRSGKFVIPPTFNTDADFRNSNDFSDGLAALTEGLRPTITHRRKFAYINKSGGIELLTDSEEAFPFHEGLALVNDEKTNKWGYIDKSGRVVIAPQFEFAEEFSEGLAAVTLAP